MHNLFVVELKDQDVINKIFGHKPLIKEVKFGTAGIEIEHQVARYSMIKLCERMKACLDEEFHIPCKPYWYVNAIRVLNMILLFID